MVRVPVPFGNRVMLFAHKSLHHPIDNYSTETLSLLHPLCFCTNYISCITSVEKVFKVTLKPNDESIFLILQYPVHKNFY